MLLCLLTFFLLLHSLSCFFLLPFYNILASEWLKNRRVIASTFKTNMLKQFFNTFVQQSLTLVEELEKIEQSGNEIICLEYLERCSLRISCGKTTHLIYF